MKTLISLFGISLIFILSACSDLVNNTPVTQENTSASLVKDNPVPFNFTLDAVSHVTPTGPYSISAVIEGHGIATHVGYYTSISNNDSYYTSPTSGIITNGTHTTYAANGDEMYATYTGTFTVENGIGTNQIDFVFSGGTGRFENLYGELQAVITTDDAGQLIQELTGSGSGYIIY